MEILLWIFLLALLLFSLIIGLAVSYYFIENRIFRWIAAALMIFFSILFVICFLFIVITEGKGVEKLQLAYRVLLERKKNGDPQVLMEKCDELFSTEPDLSESYRALRSSEGEYAASTLCASHSRTLLGLKAPDQPLSEAQLRVRI